MALAQEHRYPSRCGVSIRSQFLRAFGQPFDLSLAHKLHTFVFVGQKHIAQTRIQKITTFQYGSVMCNVPFLGSVVCCFEPSTLKEHSGTRVAVIRVLRSLKSDPIRPNPSYTGPPLSPQLCPQEGQLLMTPYRRKLQPWAGHVDAKSTPKRVNRTAALAVLFDNALVYGSTA
ncbi:hypothetical protein L227DRAFT_403899 [Lentinus tigrinus ALCF2SS1-6]|uniref:Uncharacterized protein n=1 Tax=Lentinus tigrinus ALCF2SS1-6 TaxID=1328759 RepID=A0A5C2RNX7_9APHY|nr:hypothetical protein L227DRAFT_403899 [Lentinus tigrinus ALCF2SS1-6]